MKRRVTRTVSLTSLAGLTCVLAAILLMSLTAGAAFAKVDRHAGYYYPKPGSFETYVARVRSMPKANRLTRVGFVTGMTARQSERPFPPQTAMFAKGDKAEKMIIIGLTEGRMETLYRARGELAILTALARLTPAFRDFKLEGVLTFFDLLKMLGFKQLTISDGRTFSHQIVIK